MSSKVEDGSSGAAGPACSVCSAPMPEGASRCEQCGATHGEEHRCPFCRAVAEPQPHATLRFACPACGAPRVPVRDKRFKPSKALVDHLAKARSARASLATWKVSGITAVAFGVLAVLLLVGIASIANPPAFALFMAGLVTAMPFVFGLLGWRNATARSAEITRELDAAWVEAARSMAGLNGTVTAQRLRDAFGIDDALSQQLVSRLGASSDVTTDVTDEGDLALSVRVPPKLRVDAAPEVAPSDEPKPAREEVEAATEQQTDQGGKAKA